MANNDTKDKSPHTVLFILLPVKAANKDKIRGKMIIST
jgi:hypothetical protein